MVDIWGIFYYNKRVCGNNYLGYNIPREVFKVKHKKPYDRSVFQSLSLITQFGINMIVPIAMMTWLGMYLDEKLGTTYLVILLFFVGALAGGQNVYRMAKKVYGQKEQQNNYDRKNQKNK